MSSLGNTDIYFPEKSKPTYYRMQREFSDNIWQILTLSRTYTGELNGSGFKTYKESLNIDGQQFHQY